MTVSIEDFPSGNYSGVLQRASALASVLFQNQITTGTSPATTSALSGRAIAGIVIAIVVVFSVVVAVVVMVVGCFMTTQNSKK